jgi:nitrogen-specific signal transduction histidine kinase
MLMDEQTAISKKAIMTGSVRGIVHDLANSLNNTCCTVQLLEMELKNHQRDCQMSNRELITSLKDECSRMKNRLEELRQFP